MKKNLLLTLSACFLSLGIARGGGTETAKSYAVSVGYNAAVGGTGEVRLDIPAMNGDEFDLCDKESVDPAEYSGYRIVCSDPVNVQIKVVYENGTRYPELAGGENTYTFETTLGSITNIAVYSNSGGGSVTIKEAFLIKTAGDGGEDETTYDLTAGTWGCTYSGGVTSGRTDLNFTSQWGQFNICDGTPVDTSDYSGVRISCSDPDNVQLKVTYAGYADGKYAELAEGDNVYNFETGLGNVTLIAVQDRNTGSGSVTLNSAYLIKTAAAGEEQMVYKGVPYGNATAVYAENSVTSVTYTANYGAVYLVDGDDYASFACGGGTTRYYTVTFRDPTPAKLWVDFEYASETDGFTAVSTGCSIEEGSTVAMFALDEATCENHDIDRIAIKANDGGAEYPFTVMVAGITSTEDFGEAYLSSARLGTAGFSDASYDASTGTITYPEEYGGLGWWFGDADLSGYAGVEVAFKTETTDYIQLVVEYLKTNSSDGTRTDTISASSGTTGWGNMTDGRTLYVGFDEQYASRVLQIYVQNGKTAGGTIKVAGARLIEKPMDGQPYAYEMNLAGYALTNWVKSRDGGLPGAVTDNSGAITVDDGTGTAKLSFSEAFGGLGWKNWSEAAANAGKWNLAQFDRVEITYTADGMEDWDEDTYIELFTQLNDYDTGELSNITAANTSSGKGTIVLPVSGGTYRDAADRTVDGDGIDWTGCGQLVILASKADMEVTVTGIRFVREAGTVETAGGTYDLGGGDAVLPKASSSDAVYHVKGNGVPGKHTIKFPLNSRGTYNVYLEDAAIDTSEDDALISGLTIPRGVTVNLHVLGDSAEITGDGTALAAKTSAIKGKTYGIRAALGSNLYIYMDRSATLDVGGDYGIYFLGNNLYMNNFTARGDDMFIGQINVTGKWCGIYLGEELTLCEVLCTNMTVAATGDSGTGVPGDMPAYYTGRSSEADSDGITGDYYTAGDTAHYVCGIYNASQTEFDFCGGKFVITAEGDETYGTFSVKRNGQACWFMYGSYVITATKCVMHRTDDAGKWGGTVNFERESVSISYNGPFCAHKDYVQNWDGTADDYMRQYYWYCDDEGNGSGNEYTAFVIDDNYSAKYAYTFNSEQTYGEVLYVNRLLYAGWNTLCLPYRYDLSPDDDRYENSDEDEGLEDYSGQKEARDVISKYADFSNAEKEVGGDGTETLSFTSYPTSAGASAGDIFLAPDHAYLVYVPEDAENLGDDGAVTVKFTSKYDNWQSHGSVAGNSDHLVHLVAVSNTPGAHDRGDAYDGASDEPLVTVFAPERMTKSTAEASNLYKIGGQYTESRDGQGNTVRTMWNYFNRPPESGAVVPDYRALLDATDYSVTAGTLNIKAVDGGADNGTAGIKIVGNAAASSGDVRVYSVSGQLVRIVPADGDAVSGLAGGVYVIDGRKVAVK